MLMRRNHLGCRCSMLHNDVGHTLTCLSAGLDQSAPAQDGVTKREKDKDQLLRHSAQQREVSMTFSKLLRVLFCNMADLHDSLMHSFNSFPNCSKPDSTTSNCYLPTVNPITVTPNVTICIYEVPTLAYPQSLSLKYRQTMSPVHTQKDVNKISTFSRHGLKCWSEAPTNFIVLAQLYRAIST